VSYGSYMKYGENFFFGEAINDASNWYEELDMIGAMLTPKLSNLILYYKKKFEKNDDFLKVYTRLFTILDLDLSKKFLPKIKENKFQITILNWVIYIALSGSRPEDKIDDKLNAKAKFHAYLLEKLIPKGTESKYQNTQAIVEHVFNNNEDFNSLEMPDIEELTKKPSKE
jgi:hypothetical protein